MTIDETDGTNATMPLLRRETLRSLTPTELRAVAGGAVRRTKACGDSYNCASTYTC